MYIEAIMWYYGMTRQEATDFYKLCLADHKTATLDGILTAYQQTAKQAFYND